MTSLKEIEKKYYPIYWRIVTDNEDDIEIKDRHGKIIPKNSKVYAMERDFIEEKISKELQFSGEIVCIWALLLFTVMKIIKFKLKR